MSDQENRETGLSVVGETHELALPLDQLEALAESAADLNERREAAGLPIPTSMEKLSQAGTVIFLMKREQEATLQETGEKNTGYLVLWRELTAKRYHTTFIGAQVLTRELERLPMPFRARIVKSGRTWVFGE